MKTQTSNTSPYVIYLFLVLFIAIMYFWPSSRYVAALAVFITPLILLLRITRHYDAPSRRFSLWVYLPPFVALAIGLALGKWILLLILLGIGTSFLVFGWNTFLRLPPALWTAWYRLQKKERNEALAQVNEYIRRNPNSWAALNFRFIIHLSFSYLIPAEQDARALIALRPKSDTAHSALGTALFEQSRYEEAIRAFERSQNLKDSKGLEFWVGASYYRLGDYGKAVEWLSEVNNAKTAKNPGYYLATYYLGKSLQAVGRPDDAQVLFDRLARIAPAVDEEMKREEAGLENPETLRRKADFAAIRQLLNIHEPTAMEPAESSSISQPTLPAEPQASQQKPKGLSRTSKALLLSILVIVLTSLILLVSLTLYLNSR